MLKSSFIIYGSKMVGYALRLILPFFLVRLLSKADFGAYRQFFLIEVTIAAIFQLGVNQSLYYFVPRDVKNSGAYFLNSLFLNVFIFTLVFAVLWNFADPLSRALNMPLLVDHFWQVLGFTVFLMLVVAADSFLVARQHVKAAAVFQIVNQLNLSLVTLLVTFLYRDIGTVFTTMALVVFFNFLVMVGYIHFKLNGFKAEKYFFGISTQIRYGVVLGLGGALWVLQTRIHELMVTRYFGQEMYAVYSAGCTNIPIVDMFLQSVAVVTLGQFALLEKQGDWDGIKKLYRQIQASMLGVTIPGIVFLLAVSKPLILFMFTENYAEAVDIFRVNTLLKISMVWNAHLILRAMNKNNIVVYVNLISVAVTPVFLYLGMQTMGLLGVIWAQFFTMVGSRIGFQLAYNRISGHPLPYLARLGDVMEFYRKGWHKGLALIGRGGESAG